jgi:putative endonuclease
MPSQRQVRGFEEEAVAEVLLRERGYRIVGRNVRAGRFEIDLVAWDGRALCFVEVRFRRNPRYGRAEETVGSTKRRRLIRAAMAYIRPRFPRWPVVRFDVVAVTRQGEDREVRLIRGAFDATGFL